jgi:hypothetical protein
VGMRLTCRKVLSSAPLQLIGTRPVLAFGNEDRTDARCEEILCHIVFLRSVRRLLVTAGGIPSSPILVTLMIETLSSSET